MSRLYARYISKSVLTSDNERLNGIEESEERGPSGGCAVSDSRSVTLGHAVSIRFVWALEFLSQDDVYGGSAPLAGRGTGARFYLVQLYRLSLSGM